jgi:SecY interacting protein Syd
VTLVQPWNDEDFERLQENMVAHVMMLRRLKLPLTLFLATVPNELQVISLDNESGAVLLEQLGQPKRWILADSLAEFLQRLSPLPLKTISPVAQANLPA